VRQLLSISVRFLLTIIVVLCIAVLISFIFNWSVHYAPGRPFDLSHIISSFYDAAYRLFPVCFIFSLFFTFFFVKDISKIFLLTFITVTSLAFVLFLIGYNVLHNRALQHVQPERDGPQPVLEKRINPHDMTALYVEEISEEKAETVLLRTEKGITYTPEALLSQEQSGPALVYGQEQITLPERNYWYARMFGPPSLLDRFIEDIETANNQLHTYYTENRNLFYLFSASLLFFSVSAVFFSIHSRWQVFNIFLCFLLFRVLFLLNAFSNSELMKEIGTVFSRLMAAHTHIIILLLVGGFFFIFHLLSLLRTKR
jgi:hypothetical protein